uniref:Uncharacterized protein n=1 Tax=Amphimedon queenslandica TaxID=400682 RepID=A0A1X7T7K6_AMPQE
MYTKNITRHIIKTSNDSKCIANG